ncbi:hypothetical protein MPER_01445 [Moniliophthora perniciosa FA553]|nr:hypothetical protein MPER_01445 [Moniliophthora perniciosa FA553]
MQSRRSISLFSVLLLFTQLASALPNPAARGLAARVAEPAAVDVEARGWNYGDNSDDDHRLDNNGDHKWDNNNGNRLDKWDNNDDHKWDNNNGNRLDKWDNNDDHKWDNNNGNRLDKWDNNTTING